MTVVKALVQDGTTICATIHSPTSYCFSLFDNLTMLVRGQMVYFGPQGGVGIFRISGTDLDYMHVVVFSTPFF